MDRLDRRTFLAGSVAAGVLGGGCLSPERSEAYRSYGYGPHNRGTADGVQGPTEPVTRTWHVPDAMAIQTPAVVDGRVFAATERRNRSVVVALDAESGDQQWEYDARAPVGHGWSPAVADGTLYFVDRKGTVHAVTTADGTRRWQRKLPNEQGPLNSPVVADGAVLFGLGDHDLLDFGGLYALETEDGSTRWHLEPAPDKNSPRTPAYPAVADGTVYFGSVVGGRVTAVSTTDGTTEWTARIADRGGYTGVAVAGDRLYLGGPRGQAVVSRTSRTVEWQIPDGGLMIPPAVSDGRAFVVTPEGVEARSAGGDRLWRHSKQRTVGPGPCSVVDGTVYRGARDARLYALDAENGQEKWGFGPKLSAFWTPAVVDGAVYVPTRRGLFALAEK